MATAKSIAQQIEIGSAKVEINNKAARRFRRSPTADERKKVVAQIQAGMLPGAADTRTLKPRRRCLGQKPSHEQKIILF